MGVHIRPGIMCQLTSPIIKERELIMQIYLQMPPTGWHPIVRLGREENEKCVVFNFDFDYRSNTFDPDGPRWFRVGNNQMLDHGENVNIPGLTLDGTSFNNLVDNIQIWIDALGEKDGSIGLWSRSILALPLGPRVKGNIWTTDFGLIYHPDPTALLRCKANEWWDNRRFICLDEKTDLAWRPQESVEDACLSVLLKGK